MKNFMKLLNLWLHQLSIKKDDEECKIYFLPWVTINPDKEFRIFVCKNEITAISQKHIFTVNKWLQKKTEKEIQGVVCKILIDFEQNIKEKLKFLEDYVMDLALIGQEEISYFIEPNSFGKNYAAGSALFHWIDDEVILLKNDTVEIRFVCE